MRLETQGRLACTPLAPPGGSGQQRRCRAVMPERRHRTCVVRKKIAGLHPLRSSSHTLGCLFGSKTRLRCGMLGALSRSRSLFPPSPVPHPSRYRSARSATALQRNHVLNRWLSTYAAGPPPGHPSLWGGSCPHASITRCGGVAGVAACPSSCITSSALLVLAVLHLLRCTSGAALSALTSSRAGWCAWGGVEGGDAASRANDSSPRSCWWWWPCHPAFRAPTFPPGLTCRDSGFGFTG